MAANITAPSVSVNRTYHKGYPLVRNCFPTSGGSGGILTLEEIAGKASLLLKRIAKRTASRLQTLSVFVFDLLYHSVCDLIFSLFLYFIAFVQAFSRTDILKTTLERNGRKREKGSTTGGRRRRRQE